MEEWLNKLWYLHMEYYESIKKKNEDDIYELMLSDIQDMLFS